MKEEPKMKEKEALLSLAVCYLGDDSQFLPTSSPPTQATLYAKTESLQKKSGITAIFDQTVISVSRISILQTGRESTLLFYRLDIYMCVYAPSTYSTPSNKCASKERKGKEKKKKRGTKMLLLYCYILLLLLLLLVIFLFPLKFMPV